MDILELGFYTSISVFALMAFWLIVRKSGLLPRRATSALDRLERTAILGRLVRASRHHYRLALIAWPLLAGVIAPYVVLTLFWALQAFIVAVALLLIGLAGRRSDDDIVPESRSMTLYQSIHGTGELEPGYSIEADHKRPWMGANKP